MNGVDGLANAIKERMKNRKAENVGAVQATIENGLARIGAKTYPLKSAVDVHTEDGSRVWVQLTKNGTAVVIGA